MRIDAFLWSVRLFKTRTLATHACKQDKVKLDGQTAKAGKSIKVGSRIDLRKDGIEYSYEVLSIPKSRVGAPLVPDLIKDITAAEELERKAFIQMAAKHNRRKGTGRPTKKDRRDLDQIFEN
ncbi:MAG: RNA-binding S4 domain-containing protein [Cryomorphaceae bacterium]|nr:RNA-binding S4 domain-containing protein [Cryomorphaceae bacterium]